MKELTIIIKTFERKNALSRLLKSIEKRYSTIPIIIVDDSKKAYSKYILNKYKDLNIKYIVEDFDIGLSKGRNILINNVETDYFLLCDDDFEFDERTNLEEAFRLYKLHKADILGGTVYNRFYLNSVYSVLWSLKDIRRLKKVIKKEEFCGIYNGKYKINDKNIELLINKNADEFKNEEAYITDICSNFFIGDTKKIKQIGGWTPEILKVGEHEFFFLKAKKNKLKVLYTPLFGIRHYPKKTLNYMKFRFKAEQYFKEACKSEKINEFVVKDTNNNIVYSYKKN